jgi:hypothetical protein
MGVFEKKALTGGIGIDNVGAVNGKRLVRLGTLGCVL